MSSNESSGEEIDFSESEASQHDSPPEAIEEPEEPAEPENPEEPEIDDKLMELLKETESLTDFLFYGGECHALKTTNRAFKRIKRTEHRDAQRVKAVQLTKQSSLLQGGQLREYQIVGVGWLTSLHRANINGILADEMGLGKTIQVIAFLAHLKETEEINGLHLIVAPKSTLTNWANEFGKWCPSFRCVKLTAAEAERTEVLQNQLLPGKFDVCVTTYEAVRMCSRLVDFRWTYLIVDEAQKIKNEMSSLAQRLRELKSDHRLLLTGTPLQNNLHELWSLLNFLLPNLFSNSADFDAWFNLGAEEGMTDAEVEKKNVKMVQMLHRVLRPFILRRTKSEVEHGLPPKREILVSVQMTALQRDMYKKILVNELKVNGSTKFFLNTAMELRKVCNHPFLFKGVEDEKAPDPLEHLIATSGKMKMLDKLLGRLRPAGSHVLIFSQMTSMLDILDDYCVSKNYPYCRLDGSTSLDDRDMMIKGFNDPGSIYFVFLLSTRAGGLGINLTAADMVILYDSDWNPQMDLQAMDRAHRIGQTKPVTVFRLVTQDTLEERILERQCLRLKLDSLVIQHCKERKNTIGKEDLREMLKYGADKILKATGDNSDVTDADLDAILESGEKKLTSMNQALDAELENLKRKDLIDFHGKIDIWRFENVTYSRRECTAAANKVLEEIWGAEEELQSRRRPLPGSNPFAPPPPKRDFKPIPEFRFYTNRDRVEELTRKDQETGVSMEEKEELEKLLATGFDWSKKEFCAFLRGVELHGRDNFAQIAEMIGTRNAGDVEKYASVFWTRSGELTDKDRILKSIEKKENQAEKQRNAQTLLTNKLNKYRNPLKELVVDAVGMHKSKLFGTESDRVLLYLTNIVGYGQWEQLRARIRHSNICKFDYVLTSRTSAELQRRVDYLLKMLEREEGKETTETPDDPIIGA
jgi:SWI/SNF-related matrix-associated actin-dependent regulator of chromatin subfamily A member 5